MRNYISRVQKGKVDVVKIMKIEARLAVQILPHGVRARDIHTKQFTGNNFPSVQFQWFRVECRYRNFVSTFESDISIFYF